MNKKVIILGGEGNGGVVAACIRDMNERYKNYEYEVMGFLNDMEESGSLINDYPVLGKTSDHIKFHDDSSIYFMFAIHPVGHGSLRVNLFEKLNIPENKLATIVHPSAFVGYNVNVRPGAMIMANSYVGPASTIGKCALLMSNTVVGHNTKVGDFCHISVGSVISSYVKMETASDVALNATVIEKITIEKYAVVGAGAMITKPVYENEIVVGNPQRVLRLVTDKRRY